MTRVSYAFESVKETDLKGFKQLEVLQKTYFQVTSDLQSLDRVLFEFNRIHQNWIPKQDWLQCQLALVEGFTNAVRHAHKNIPTDVPIGIELILFREYLQIKIWDRGPFFDLDRFIENMPAENTNSSEGGRGIPILYKIADILRYIRTSDKRNCLLIIKYFS